MMPSAHSAAWGNKVPAVLLESGLESAVCAHIIVEGGVLILKALAVNEFRIPAECLHDLRMGRTELVESLQVSHREIARGRARGGNLDLSALCKSFLVTGKHSRD
jgi:acid phosphatase family membrane protein YuiD